MPKVTCYVTEINLMHSLPTLDEDVTVGGLSLAEHFRSGSATTDGAAIDLTIDWSRRNITLPGSNYGVDDGQLQAALELLLRPIPQSSDAQVGLILANFYTTAGQAYGYMFDLDFHSSGIGPRQGCALFLKQIQNVTGSDEQAFRELVAFTAVHEIGHAFNLWHVDNPISFMKQPPYGDLNNACGFVPDHQTYLQCAADPMTAPYVVPGLLARSFGTRVPGLGFPSGSEDSYAITAPSASLELRIGLSHDEFWHFEPVELEVELTVPNQESGAIVVPEEMDPGYSRFEIWITRPDGEQHRYRPSRRHCSNPATVEISHTKPYRRDIPIFLQSGSYTFPMTGRYAIQVRLRLSADQQLVSNIVECEALKPQPDSEVYVASRDALSSAEAVRLLRYRSRLPHRSDFARLVRFTERHPSQASAATVGYSLGKVLLKAAEANPDDVQDLREQGLNHLTRAAEHHSLGTHRRSVISRLIR